MKRNKRFEIIQPGISISSRYSTNGTLGLIVYDKKNDLSPCILSNWHVLAKRSFIPRLSFRVGRPIYQPGKLFEGKDRSNIVGKLLRYDRYTDSAIAKIVNREFKLEQYESNVRIKSFREPKIGDIVEKSGARTNVTRGVIHSVNNNRVTIKTIKEGNPDDIEISRGGDSGSLWYDPQTLEGLVLHNSGEKRDDPDAEFARGYSLITVIQRLEIALTNNAGIV